MKVFYVGWQQHLLIWYPTAFLDSGEPTACFFEDDVIIVANIASPQTVKNIRQNKNVCISFIDILKQKGFQLKGTAEIIQRDHPVFAKMEEVLLELTKGNFPFATITKINVHSAKPIIAPKYVLYPETTEQEQVESARKTYGL